MDLDIRRAPHRTIASKRRLFYVAAITAALLVTGAALTSRGSIAIHALCVAPLTAALVALGLLPRSEGPFPGRPAADMLPTGLRQSRPELIAAHRSLVHSLSELAKQSDPILREATGLKLAAIQQEMQALASAKLIFGPTEAWRTVYERILRTPGLPRYFSVAWLRNEDYWRDAPGRHSMQLNYDLVQLGVRFERTLILNDFFWPPAALLPAKVVYQWAEDQYKRGIVVRLVRESEIEDEPELLADFGIYGIRATGLLELDDQCRTLRFTLDFDPRSVKHFEERWRRLLLYAISFRELLDRRIRGG